MSTVQIVGIAVAAAVVVLLVVALLVTRRRRGAGESAAPAADSFLDAAPQDTLARLGRPEQPVEDVTLDPLVEQDRRPVVEPASPGPSTLTDGELATPPEYRPPSESRPPAATAGADDDALLHLAWGPTSNDLERTDEIPAVPAPEPVPSATAPPPAASTPPPSTVTESGTTPTVPTPAWPAEGGSAAESQTAPESGAGGRRVPLSDILITTNDKLIDLDDRDVRRMLTDLVKYEIDQATALRAQGHAVDAVLQLTEAEKISQALGMRDSAAAIRKMMDDLRGLV